MMFIALQCCNCSTMQVKQQKKSSNKWSCVICNEKQSVRKVFAQGGIARDLRSFVQSFNMSRSEPFVQPQEAPTARNKRKDWSQYLDFHEDPETVTFKKPKFRADFDGFPDTGMERRGDKRADAQVQEFRTCDEPMRASKWNQYLIEDQSLQNNWEIANASECDNFDGNMVEEQIHPDFL